MEEMKVLSTVPKNKVIIVSGGYGHLGRAIVASLFKNGATVYVAARSKLKFIETFDTLVKSDSERLKFIYYDISNSDSIREAFLDVLERSGRIDGLINNAFYLRGLGADNISREDFSFTLNGSLVSVFESIKILIPLLSEGASIVNVSSMYGMVAPDFCAYKYAQDYMSPPHYGAAKAGVIQLTKYYSSLLGPKGILVNSVSPGPFPNYAIQENTLFMNELKNRTILGRYGSPEELAGIFTFLMSDSAKYITGQNFVVDGGWTVR